jgi:hypothetical protein
VEASGLAKGDLRQLSHGTVISFSPPDDYCVEWSDGSTTCYGYSHLFSAGRLPLVLPVPPAQWASYEAAPLEATTQQTVRGTPQRANNSTHSRSRSGTAGDTDDHSLLCECALSRSRCDRVLFRAPCACHGLRQVQPPPKRQRTVRRPLRPFRRPF